MQQPGWFVEKSFHRNIAMGWKVKSVLHEEDSQFQNIKVLDTHAVGRLLLLDDKTMVSHKDEFVYHEVMAHIPFMVSPKCENVLIIGGGDGGVVREFAKHDEVQKIDLVEIDQRVVEVSKLFFPECTSALDDPRVSIHYKDGFEFIKNTKIKYDVIVIDSTDPEDFASGLFTANFYQDVAKALSDHGIMMNQTENPFYDEYGIRKIYQNMRKNFAFVNSFSAPMSIYPGVYWTFGFSSQKLNATHLQTHKLNQMHRLERELKWYNTQWHKGCFSTGNLHKRMTGL